MEPVRSVLDLDREPWVSVTGAMVKAGCHGTFETKKLVAPDGRSVRLVHYDGDGPPHFHLRSSSLFVLSGAIELRDRVAGTGTWVLEPFGAIHPRTLFKDVTYGFGMSDGVGPGYVLVDDPERVPQWMTDAGAHIEDYACIVDPATLPWQPFGPGLATKVLHVFDGHPAFAALIRAEAGATLPRRRYVGPVDMYVLSGRAQFSNAVAEQGWWIHEPAGAVDDAVTFPVASELLVNTYGTVLEYGADESIARIIDGYSLKS